MRDASIGEKAVVKERTFEDEVNQRIKEVPDEDYAELDSSGCMEKACGGEIGGEKERKGC